MKTLVYRRRPASGMAPTIYGDAYLPVDAPADANAPGMTPLPVAKFVPAHVTKYHTMDMRTLKTGPETKRREPDRVRCGNCEYDVARGVVDGIRVMPEDALSAIAVLDVQLAELDQQRTTVRAMRAAALEDGYVRGRALRVAELKP